MDMHLPPHTALRFWKLSHGKPAGMSEQDHRWLVSHGYVSQGYGADDDRGKGQGQAFHGAVGDGVKGGDTFYLVRSGRIVLLGRFADSIIEEVPAHLTSIQGWFMRRFELIKDIEDVDFASTRVEGAQGWKPQGNTTVYPVPSESVKEFETVILAPAFGLTLDQLGGAGNPATGPASPELASGARNRILYGPPGTGKTYHTVIEALKIIEGKEFSQRDYLEQKRRFDALRSAGRIAFVTFHQSFSYEDFVEGIRAETRDGSLHYVVKDGLFKQLAYTALFSKLGLPQPADDQAYADAKKAVFEAGSLSMGAGEPHVLIIDEINRGNTSRVFGELITLIEESKRVGADEMVELSLPYSGERFGVPDNLYIVGTMNTADRSLAVIDTALRRRFDFIEMMPKPTELKAVVEGVNLQRMLAAMNERIEYLYDREHMIGHAFFIKLDGTSTVVELAQIFRNKILPLLEEYFFEDWGKIAKVLGNAGIYEPKSVPAGLESNARIYRRNERRLDDVNTYLRIYGGAAAPEQEVLIEPAADA